MEYPWYQKIDRQKDLQQGDIIPDCPVIIPPGTLEQGKMPDVDVQTFDAVILSQSCDLANEKLENILVGRIYTLKAFMDELQADQTKNKAGCKKVIDNLRKGHFNAYHLFNKEEFFFKDYLVVDFKNIYGIHRSALMEIVDNLKTRVRLLPPYREHLSQAFARYFMRVGLPQDITVEVE